MILLLRPLPCPLAYLCFSPALFRPPGPLSPSAHMALDKMADETRLMTNDVFNFAGEVSTNVD